MSLLLLHYCDAPGDSRTTISAKSISQIFFVPLFPDKRVIGHRPLHNFVPNICIYQKMFVPFLSQLRSERSDPEETVHSAREQRYFAFGTWVAMADSLRRRGLR